MTKPYLTRFVVLTALLVAAAAIAGSRGPAPALAATGATIMVTTTDDEFDNVIFVGLCSLREAIESANEDEDYGGCTHTGNYNSDDLIILDSETYAITIDPVLGDNETGDFDISEGVTIQGNGRSSTIINGAGKDRVFEVAGEVGADIVTLESLRITGGDTDDDGGGIYNGILSDMALNVVLNDVLVDHNTAGVDGGGIYSDGGSLTLINSSVNENEAISSGGGIYVEDGTLTVQDGSEVDENTARSQVINSGFGGGGIYVIEGDLEVTDSEVNGNHVENGGLMGGWGFGGGGIYLAASGGSVARSVINDNTVDGTGIIVAIGGGGIYVAGAMAQGFDIQEAPGTLSLDEVTMAGNTADNSNGGGIYVNEGATLELTNSTIGPNNTATTDDIIIGPPTLLGGDGGGIYSNNGVAHISNSTISGNTAEGHGGGLYLHGGAETDLDLSTISDNEAPTGANIATGVPADINTLSYFATIVANPIDGENCVYDEATGITSSGYNIEDDDTCDFDPSGDDLVDTDPLLEPLANNGGPTQTHALSESSPAIDLVNGDAIECPPPTRDQRDLPRPVDGDDVLGALCDSGAYEFQLELPASLSITKTCPNGAGDATFNVAVTGATALPLTPIACDASALMADLESGDYTIAELISGADSANFTTAIVCQNADGSQTTTQGTNATVALTAGVSTSCVIVNVLNTVAVGDEGPVGSPTCSDGIDNDGDGFIDNTDAGCGGTGGVGGGGTGAPIIILPDITNILNNLSSNTNTDVNTNTNTLSQNNVQNQANDNVHNTDVNSSPTQNVNVGGDDIGIH